MASHLRKTGKSHRPWTPDVVRERIKVGQLLNLQQAFALGEIDKNTGKPIELSVARVRAIESLLRKAIPDMKHVEHSGTITHEHRAVSATAQWLSETLSDGAVRAPAESRPH